MPFDSLRPSLPAPIFRAGEVAFAPGFKQQLRREGGHPVPEPAEKAT